MNEPGTRTQLLKVARAAFAAHGFDGASVRLITTAAHANLGAITYHFGSKRKLYEQVLSEAVAPMLEAVTAALDGAGPALERAAAVVRAYFQFLVAHPDVARLMVQELVLGKSPEATVLPIGRMHGLLTELVLAGQRNGEFRDGNAAVMALGIISQSLHMNVVRRPLKAFTGIDIDNPQTRAQVIEEVAASVCASLRRPE